MSDELRIPDDWSADDVRRWMLQLFGRMGYSVLPGMSSQIDAPVRIQTLFDRSASKTQELLKSGAVKALREWRAQAHGFQALDQLSRTTALLRCTEAVPILSTIAARQLQEEENEERLRTLSKVIACLCGFTPGDDVEAALRRLFYDKHLKPPLVGQLFVGLCYCRPEAYPSYAARFLKLREKVPGKFRHIGPALLHAIPPVTLIDKFGELDDAARKEFADILRDTPNSEIHFMFSEKGVEIYWIHSPLRSILISPKSVTAKVDNFASYYANALDRVKGIDPGDRLLQMTVGDLN